MGSKNLKALAIRGTKGVGNIADPAAFMSAVNAGKQVLAENPVTGQGLPAFGTQVLMNVINEIGAMPTRNFREVQFEGASKISGEAMKEKRPSDGKANLVRNAGCFGCTIACGRISKIDQGHFSVKNSPKYWEATPGAWSTRRPGRWARTPGWMTWRRSPTRTSCAMSTALTRSPSGRRWPRPWSSTRWARSPRKIWARNRPISSSATPTALCKAAELTGTAQGFGRILGLGSKRLCAKYGHPELSMTVKGQEFPAYDPRGIQGMGLAYATSNRGACHLRSYTVASEVLGIPEKTDPLATEGKAGLVKAFQDATAAVDSSGLCVFTTFAWTMEDIAPQVDAACEGEWTPETMMEVGERIWNLERQFNMDAGLTPADDNLPPRLMKEGANTGPAQGKSSGLDEMLPEYYQLRGWGEDGYITDETKQRLGL